MFIFLYFLILSFFEPIQLLTIVPNDQNEDSISEN